MTRLLPFLAFFAFTIPAYAQSVVCNPLCSQQSSASNAASRSTAASRSSSSATGAIAGTQVNAPITTHGGNARASGGNANVVVVNRVGGGGGYHGGNPHSGSAGAVAADPPPADPGPVLGSAGNPLTENIGGTTTVRNTPEIVAPNISGGNPCLVGVSGGGAGPGIGITLGIGYSDKGCERRNSAALLNNMGEKDVAQELMCDDDHVRAAMMRTGHPCAADRPRPAVPVAAQGVQTAAQGPIDAAVIRRQQAAASPQPPPKPQRPEWCATASPDELRHYPQCDGR